MEWRKTTLGDVCDEVDGVIQTGPFGSQLHESDYSDEGIPVVMPKDIVEGRITTEGIARVSLDHVHRLSKHRLQAGDIVYGRRGDIGRQALITAEQAGWLCGTGCLRLSFGGSVLDPAFLHYFLRQDDLIQWITKQAVGATMPNLNTGILRSIPVRFPALPEQRRIATILSAYDDLIENNLRRIQILEEMARALYREWFVEFRFPGREDHEIISSQSGEIPKGWRIARLDEITTKIGSGATPRGGKEAYHAEGITLVRSLNVYDYRFENADLAFIDEEQAAELDNVALQEFDVLLNITGASVNRCCMVPAHLLPGRVNQHVAIIRADPEKCNGFFLLDALNSHLHKTTLFGLAQGGATREALTREALCKYEVILPPKGVLERYQKIAGQIHSEQHLLSRKNEILRKTRDLLLPKLLSGGVANG